MPATTFARRTPDAEVDRRAPPRATASRSAHGPAVRRARGFVHRDRGAEVRERPVAHELVDPARRVPRRPRSPRGRSRSASTRPRSARASAASLVEPTRSTNSTATSRSSPPSSMPRSRAAGRDVLADVAPERVADLLALAQPDLSIRLNLQELPEQADAKPSKTGTSASSSPRSTRFSTRRSERDGAEVWCARTGTSAEHSDDQRDARRATARRDRQLGVSPDVLAGDRQLQRDQQQAEQVATPEPSAQASSARSVTPGQPPASRAHPCAQHARRSRGGRCARRRGRRRRRW